MRQEVADRLEARRSNCFLVSQHGHARSGSHLNFPWWEVSFSPLCMKILTLNLSGFSSEKFLIVVVMKLVKSEVF